MGSLYYDWASILSNAGCKVGVNSINAGWERRARSSGGFSAVPLGIWWHHTASKTSVEGDLTWQCHSCPDKPVGNMLLARDGTFWPVAGGASNCAGKGGPWTFSRGTVPLDSGNTGGVQIECANNGVGEPYPQAQIDAYFRGSNAINAFLGNQPTDIVSHRRWAPSRKIDPATNSVVQGPWQPRSETSSGTWNLDDMKAECSRRAGAGPGPGPEPGPTPPQEDDDVNTPATVWVGPQLHNFARGSDGALWHNSFEFGTGWHPWESLGGVITSAPSATVTDDGQRIDVTARGADGALWQIFFTFADGWSAWNPIMAIP